MDRPVEFSRVHSPCVFGNTSTVFMEMNAPQWERNRSTFRTGALLDRRGDDSIQRPIDPDLSLSRGINPLTENEALRRNSRRLRRISAVTG